MRYDELCNKSLDFSKKKYDLGNMLFFKKRDFT